MKKNKYPHKSVVYAVRPKHVNKKLLKIGKTSDLKHRIDVINNSLPDHVDVLYYIETNDIDKLENLIKMMMIKYIYKHGKEYYKISLPKTRIIFNECFKFMNELYKIKTEKHKIKRLNAMIQLDKNIEKEIERHGLLKETNCKDNITIDDFLENSYDDADNDINNEMNFAGGYISEDVSDNDISDDDITNENIYYIYKMQKYKYKYMNKIINSNDNKY